MACVEVDGLVCLLESQVRISNVETETRVLLFGENDGSFAVAAAARHPTWRMLATELCHTKAPEQLLSDGHQWLTGIDALKMPPDVEEEAHNADILVFNFPFVAQSPRQTVDLIKGFLQLVHHLCKQGAKIILGLATQCKGTDTVAYQYKPYSAESVVADALRGHARRDGKFVHLACDEVDHTYYTKYPGYSHGTTHGHAKPGIWHFNNQTAYIFHVQVSNDRESKQRSLTRSLKVLADSCPDRVQERMRMQC